MKISFNWLKNYIDLRGIELNELLDKITLAGFEVEEVIDQAAAFNNIVVGYVKQREKHPNADKLSICVVSDGNEEYKVVCGAPNVAREQKIAFAKVGAVVPEGGFKIEKAKIRGEESFGMICSEKELGLSQDHSGIMVLDSSVKEGTEISKVLGLDDVIIDLAVTANRGDALSHIGIAREFSALFNRPLKVPEVKLKTSEQDVSNIASVEIIDPEGCPRYTAMIIKNVEVKESPEWMKTFLKNVGLRPINNIVDITNFVLYEYGQPLHAFDLNKVAGKKIIVKRAEERSSFVTLDSKTRVLKSSDLLICDAEKPVALAGVMGGENSEVTSETKDILLESAYFNPSVIRKTAKRLSLSSDASYRFERGCDPENLVRVAQRAASLMAELGNGEVLNGVIDAYPVRIVKDDILLRKARITRILGYEIPSAAVKDILANLGFGIISENEDSYLCSVPSYRSDIEREIDIIEEIARIYGYENIPQVERIAVTLDSKTDSTEFTGKVRTAFTSFGFNEIISNSLLNEKEAVMFGKAIAVMNPQSTEMSHLRPSLIPGMLHTISRNFKVAEKELKFFEIGHIFNRKNEVIEDFKDFEENNYVLAALSGYFCEDNWYMKERKYDIYDIKGYAETFFSKMLKNVKIREEIFYESDSILEYSIKYNVFGKEVGKVGKVNTKLLEFFDISSDVFIFYADIEKIKEISYSEVGFKELLKYPKVVRDFALVMDKSVQNSGVEAVIRKNKASILKEFMLFDLFEGQKLGNDKKSMAYKLVYFDESKTLTEEEVDKDFWKIIEILKKEFNAVLRG